MAQQILPKGTAGCGRPAPECGRRVRRKEQQRETATSWPQLPPALLAASLKDWVRPAAITRVWTEGVKLSLGMREDGCFKCLLCVFPNTQISTQIFRLIGKLFPCLYFKSQSSHSLVLPIFSAHPAAGGVSEQLCGYSAVCWSQPYTYKPDALLR